MSPALLRLVLLVSCAHALVHSFELALPSVEQEISQEFYPSDDVQGKRYSGLLSNYWRLCWGLGALVAGWLVDRYGSYRLLAIFLGGCGLTCIATYLATQQQAVMYAMLMMGAFASIYHPAGLALISHKTTTQTRPYALGVHGIFGSIGISAAPLLAAFVLMAGFNWHQYYLFLAVPAFLLGTIFLVASFADRQEVEIHTGDDQIKQSDLNERTELVSFFMLTVVAVVQGFVYSAQVSFLPRYLSLDDTEGALVSAKVLASLALLLGCIGQYVAGRYANPERLETQLTWITLGNIPCLFLMAFALGPWRFVAAGTFAIVHFMHQPIYNSLIAKYSSRRRRSLFFGISFAIGFGFGSFGARFAGNILDETTIYCSLAGIMMLGAVAGWALSRRNRRHLKVENSAA